MKSGPLLQPLQAHLSAGHYSEVISSDAGRELLRDFTSQLYRQSQDTGDDKSTLSVSQNAPGSENGTLETQIEATVAAAVALASFNAFLQANVTGPVFEAAAKIEQLFRDEYDSARKSEDNEARTGQTPTTTKVVRNACLRSLDVDGVSVYSHTPNIELFCFARWVLCRFFNSVSRPEEDEPRHDGDDPAQRSLLWLQLRVHVWHYKLLTQPTLGSGSVFNKAMQWSDVPSLQERIENTVSKVEQEVIDDHGDKWLTTDKVLFLLEKANIYIMIGGDAKAKHALHEASKRNGFDYALSGALGKRTRFQEKSTSQLVVLARSSSENGRKSSDEQAMPEAKALNDDTLLEAIDFNKEAKKDNPAESLPDSLKDMKPDDQPSLAPLDQMILLTEATLKDSFSPLDTLTSEEILPYAVRVISDKSTNWQIYTQALLVRSRIELHRSRTVERGVLQMQALVDQIIVDATSSPEQQNACSNDKPEASNLPAIEVTAPEAAPLAPANKPTSFFPVAKVTESAPAQVRLRYVHALSSPPRWHLESEMAYAWAGVGSLVSALEIFKRLRMWAEVALCLAGNAASGDEDGRGAGGEGQARAVLRWQLFRRKGEKQIEAADDTDEEDMDVKELKADAFTDVEKKPSPPNAPRLFCILGDMDNEPAYYERAWEISKGRFSRAQKSLGEYCLQQKDWEGAREAYKKAVAVHRLSPELWSRLGDINLRLGHFSDAAEAFSRAIGASNDSVGGEEARTWSNLGSALWSMYLEAVEEKEKEKEKQAKNSVNAEEGDTSANLDDIPAHDNDTAVKKDAGTLLSQSLAAYKRGASIAHSNWRIWDNVMTLASRVRPPVIPDIILALRNVISIRKTEESIDDDVLRLLLSEAVLNKPKPTEGEAPARGSQEKSVCDLMETIVVPLITKRSELWELVTRERLWRRDLAGAIDAAEKAWRAATGGVSGASLGTTVGTGDSSGKGNWLVDKEAWDTVVTRTDELVSVLENYGPEVEAVGSRWKSKARSAVRSVMSKGRESWVGTDGWTNLENLLDGLK